MARIKTQYTGVRYREHKTRKHNGKPDRYFTIFYKLNGKTKEEGLGWSSEGWTAQKASLIRAELKKAQATGEGAVTLKEKRTIAEEKKKAAAEKKAREERERLTLNEAAKKYIEWAKNNKRSWKDDETRLRLHVSPLLGNLPLSKIGIPEAEKLKSKCQKKGLAPATVIQCLAVLRAVCNFCLRNGLYTGTNPVKGMKLPKLNNKRLRFLARQEADDLLELALKDDPELYDICLLCLYTGIRSGEMAALRWQDIDFEHGIITIMDGKNGESRQAFMTNSLRDMLERRRKAAPNVCKQTTSQSLIFPTPDGKVRQRVSKQFKKIVDKLGLNDGIDDPRQRVYFHTLRHTFASWLALNGETLLTIKELMGHKTIAMTMRYAHLIPDQKRKAVERLSS